MFAESNPQQDDEDLISSKASASAQAAVFDRYKVYIVGRYLYLSQPPKYFSFLSPFFIYMIL